MDSSKYRNLSQYLIKKFYPEGPKKQDKTTQPKSAKKFLYNYVAKEKGGTASHLSTLGEREGEESEFKPLAKRPCSTTSGRYASSFIL